MDVNDLCASTRLVVVREGAALVAACSKGHAAVVELLLEWPHHAPQADCQNGAAMMAAWQYPEVLALLQAHMGD